MTFAPRTAFGSYEITELIGVGGMGEVYRARDRQLQREVALKVLPEAHRLDPEALQRFEREARLLASLNHPNIATLHGLETAGDAQALVMELVEGETLEERIAHTPRGRGLALHETLEIAAQIAAALEAAHERGVVHRDLKPANIKVRKDGTVKVLDFGIAKALSTDATEPAGKTITRIPDAPIGTPSYMSPEQASGAAVDRRADLWAFGCVLYEMLTGQRAFAGETSSQTLARVIEREPDWSRLPADVPARVRVLLHQCLTKDARKRRRDAGDVRLELEQASAEPRIDERVATTGGSRRPRLWIVGAAVLGTLAIPAALYLRETPVAEIRAEISTPPTLAPLHFALSPDGLSIVFVASVSSSDNSQRLYLRSLDSTEALPLPGTEGARYPFWSPDSRSIGFFAAERLFRVDVAGGRPQALAPAPNPVGGTWNASGTILFVPHTVSPVLKVPASGGEHTEATELDATSPRPGPRNHRFPSFLPNGRQFLFYVVGEPEESGIYLGSLDGEAPKRLAAADCGAVAVAPDHVAFVQQGALVARRLDAERGEVTGEPLTLAASFGADAFGYCGFSASANGTLAYRTSGPRQNESMWFDAAGNVLEVGAPMNGPDLSPDERYLAYDDTEDGNRDVWIVDRERGGTTRFTTDAAVDGYPVWSPDGEQLIFESQRNGTFDIWIAPTNRASEELLLLGTPDSEIPLDWSGDGRYLLYRKSDADYRSSDVRALPLSGEDRTPIAVADSPFEERMGAFSPDGGWVAYDTDRSGRFEIMVRAFPEPGEEFPVSTGGGIAPQWSADGGKIYFVAPDGTMMAARVATTSGRFEAERPVPLFATRIALQVFNHQYAVTKDERFFVFSIRADAAPTPITLVLNWKP